MGTLRCGRAVVPAAVAVAALLGAVACSAQPASSAFTPEGGGPSAPGAAAATGTGSSSQFIMPPFGPDVRVSMTNWVPPDASQAAAVITDKNYELAYLYAEYKGGQDESWVNYVSPVMKTAVQQSLQGPDVTTESFSGTIRYFDMSVIPDPLVKGDLDVSVCFDNAGSSNTDIQTGKVIPDTSSPDTHYARIADELRKDPAGQWQVVSSLPAIYYPQAKQCKPA